MIEIAVDPKNGDDSRKRAFTDRLARALEWDTSVPAGRSVADEPGSAESPLNSLQASASCRPPVLGMENQGLGEQPASPPDTEERKQDELPDPDGIRIEQACMSIADAVVGTVARAAEDLRRQAASDRAKLEATADSASRVSREIDQVRADLAFLSPRVESLAQGEAGLRSTLGALDDRIRREEELSQSVQERLDKLLTERLDALSGSMQAQIDANVRLDALCAKLEARLTAQDHTIQALEAEIRQRGGMVERILGALRSLDLRREPRFPANKAVKVVVRGEKEAVIGGRIVDASENGLGLVLETPTPVGSEVRVDVDDTQLSGEVTYCGPRGDGYAAGLKLAAPLRK